MTRADVVVIGSGALGRFRLGLARCLPGESSMGAPSIGLTPFTSMRFGRAAWSEEQPKTRGRMAIPPFLQRCIRAAHDRYGVLTYRPLFYPTRP